MVIDEINGALTIPGAARRSLLSESQLRHAIVWGQLKAGRAGGRIVIAPEDLARYAASKGHKLETPAQAGAVARGSDA